MPFLAALIQAWRTAPVSAHVDPSLPPGHRTPAAPVAPPPVAPAAHASTHPHLAPWLLVSWLVMFLGALFSGYVLIRAGSLEWTMHAGSWPVTITGGLLLLAAALACRPGRLPLAAAAAAAGIMVAWLSQLHGAMFAAGQTPASHLEFASWFTITGVLLILTLLLGAATIVSALGDRGGLPSRARGLRVVYGAMSLSWFVILSAFSRG